MMMNKRFFTLLTVSCLLMYNDAWAFQSLHVCKKSNHPNIAHVQVRFASADNNQDDEATSATTPTPASAEASPGLILDVTQVQAHMNQLKSKYPTQEADYLAAARKRAELKVASRNDETTDDDWKRAAREKQQLAQGIDGDTIGTDGWEASLQDAGNAESQILIPVDLFGQEGNEEPKLLL